MKIKSEIVDHVKKNTTIKAKICEATNKHFGSVERWLTENKDNGPLTGAAVLKVLTTALSCEPNQILEEETKAVA